MANARAAGWGKPTDSELLAIARSERARSIGFDLDPTLLAERERALYYAKGEMPDVPSRPNRSSAVSTDVADAVETVLPDLVEIFTAGDDVASFIPSNEQDVEQAQQETEYLHHVLFGSNQGWLTLYAFLKDALLTKTGIVKWWWENKPDPEIETFEQKTALEVAMAMRDGEINDLKLDGQPFDPETATDDERAWIDQNLDQPVWSFTTTKEGPDGKANFRAVPPEDFTVARDTVVLAMTTYCAFRSRPRAQDLKADGHDPDIIDTIPAYGLARNEQVQLARDTAGEHAFPISGEGPDRDMRAVEVVEHFFRRWDPEQKRVIIWRVFTANNEGILIDSEQVDQIPFAAVTPFLVTHRFYGESLADKLLEIQRIKTALLRGQLDSIYFALNMRHYVDMTKTNAFTISDLLNNEPGMPIRGDGDGAVTPVQSGGGDIPYLQALEYASTMAEQRTGVVRNAQGLNPDTLHDTMGGAIALMNAAQRRVRMIARVCAETGIKDFFLGVHALIRKHASQKTITRLRGKFVPVDPTEWAERTDMTIEVGVGAGGMQQRGAALQQVIGAQAEVRKMGGANLVTDENIYKALTDATKAAGIKTPQDYFTDPTGQPPQQPPPNPEMMKLQAEQQSQAADRQQTMQIEQMKDQREKAALAADHARELAKIESSERLERERLAQEAALAKYKADLEFKRAVTIQGMKSSDADMKARTDLAIQASESADSAEMARGDRVHDFGLAALDNMHDIHMRDTAPDPVEAPQ